MSNPWLDALVKVVEVGLSGVVAATIVGYVVSVVYPKKQEDYRRKEARRAVEAEVKRNLRGLWEAVGGAQEEPVDQMLWESFRANLPDAAEELEKLGEAVQAMSARRYLVRRWQFDNRRHYLEETLEEDLEEVYDLLGCFEDAPQIFDESIRRFFYVLYYNVMFRSVSRLVNKHQFASLSDEVCRMTDKAEKDLGDRKG